MAEFGRELEGSSRRIRVVHADENAGQEAHPAEPMRLGGRRYRNIRLSSDRFGNAAENEPAGTTASVATYDDGRHVALLGSENIWPLRTCLRAIQRLGFDPVLGGARDGL